MAWARSVAVGVDVARRLPSLRASAASARGKVAWTTGLTRPSASNGQTWLSKFRAMAALKATGRGRKVSASVTLPTDVVRSVLRTDIDAMLDYGRVAALGASLSGQFGAQAHYANGLAAFYIATGQDAACVAESAVGFTRMERRADGIFCAVTLPNILVGTVGGGTGLPSQRAALNVLGLTGPGSAAALAEIVAALCLCGEISIVAAMAAGHFTAAHRKLARRR